MKKKLIIIVSILTVTIGLVGFNQKDNNNFEIGKNLDIYFSLFRELNAFYVDDIEPAKLIKTSIDNMLESLDPYTTYIPESDIEDFRFMTTGEYAGIGALIGKKGDQIIVSEPYEGFPAQKAGLKAGDVFLSIGDKKTEGMTTQNVSDLLKGQAGENIQIEIRRSNSKKPLKFDVVREKIAIDPISYQGMVDDKTGYIRLSSFTKDCGEKVKSAFLDLKENQGAEQMILDLRGNPGGLLIESVNLCNIFIGKGEEVVSTRGKVSQWDKTYKTFFQPVDTIMPLVVLTNRGSASASEIVSGTIQDLDRGVVIGSRTFGKGLVQTTRDLSYNSKLKVTTAKYYIPSGRCIQMLDYSHRNDDGSVGNIPDSLISEFQTRNGRKVYDGGGVAPDIKVESETISSLTIRLIQNYLVFDFATDFAQKNPTIAQPQDFQVTDDLYNDFISFVDQNDFEFETRSEKKLEELIKLAKAEKSYEDSEEDFEALRANLKHDLHKDLMKFKNEISELITDEIVSRYYYQRGSAIAALQDDKSVAKAIEVLNDKEQYQSILQPEK